MDRGFSESRPELSPRRKESVSSPPDYARQKGLSKARVKNLPSRSSRAKRHTSGAEDEVTCGDAEIALGADELSAADLHGTSNLGAPQRTGWEARRGNVPLSSSVFVGETWSRFTLTSVHLIAQWRNQHQCIVVIFQHALHECGRGTERPRDLVRDARLLQRRNTVRLGRLRQRLQKCKYIGQFRV
jgi:hypothetical protein